jgi:hypothetical protein
MPRVAVIPFPEIDIDEASQIADRVVREFKGTISNSGLARALSMAERGGGYLKKVAALREYGLVEGRGELRATDLAQKIAYPNSVEEKNDGKRQAFLRVELFARLAERLGSTVPDEERFAIFVEELTKAPRMEVAARVARLRRIYAEGAKYLDEQVPPAVAPMPTSATREPGGEPLPGGFVELKTAEIQVRLPLNAGSLKVLKTILDNLENSVGPAPDNLAGGDVA